MFQLLLQFARISLLAIHVEQRALHVGSSRQRETYLGKLHTIAQQAQERSEAPFDHRRLLDAGYAVVMS